MGQVVTFPGAEAPSEEAVTALWNEYQPLVGAANQDHRLYADRDHMQRLHLASERFRVAFIAHCRAFPHAEAR